MVRHHNRAVRKGVKILNNNQEDVVVQSEVEPTTQTSSPQVEVPATEEQTVQDQPEQAENEQASDVESEVKPNDPREYQARRLADENRRLKSERKGSAFDSFRPQVQAPQGVDVQQYTDAYGEVNWAAYNAAVNNHIQQVASTQSQQVVKELLDEQNARNKHPELFADPETEKEMAAMWLFEKTQGNDIAVSDIADRYAKRFSKDVSKAEKRGAEKMLQEVSQKEQAGLTASGQTASSSRQQQSDEDHEVLSQQTRVGNQDAIVARLQGIPWANK